MARTAVYWDASVILSLFTGDDHAEDALFWFSTDSVHLISTLTYAEVCAVLRRFQREHLTPREDVIRTINSLHIAPWRRLNINPAWDVTTDLSEKCTLKGADLWHLSLARTLRNRNLWPLHLLTYDARLRDAARHQGLIQGGGWDPRAAPLLR